MLSDLQARLEKSIYERIRTILVEEGYLPARNPGRYTPDKAGELNWQTDIKSITTNKEFAVEPFSNSGIQDKGMKSVPRIVIIARRYIPGETGAPINGQIFSNPVDPNNFVKVGTSLESMHLHLDVNLVTASANQDRILNAVIFKALGTKTFIPFSDSINERFFLKQFNYYDLPDAQDGLMEKVYSYEIQDLYMYEDLNSQNVSPIKEITQELEIENYLGIITPDGKLVIDLSGIKYQ